MTTTSSLSTLEKIFLKEGEVLSVRPWQGGNVHEIDVHVPIINFEKWDTPQSMKCRISGLHFTDYTPATWDTEAQRCTLFIDTGHNGQGSRWAKRQHAGNPFYYLKTEAERHYPAAGKTLFFLGDATAIGHFSALQQLAIPGTNVNGCMTFIDTKTANAFAENCPWLPLQTVASREAIYHRTEQWIQRQTDKESCMFYIVGNHQLVIALRKLLKQYGVGAGQIKAKGFWQ